MHRNLARAEDFSKPTKRGEYQYVSGVMGIALNPFLDSEAGNAYMNLEVPQLLKFWTEIDPMKRERRSLGLLLENMPEMIRVPRSNKRVELKMGNENEKRKQHVHYEFGDCLEVSETLLVPTSPREFD